MKNLATVIRIKSARVQRQLILQVSLQKRINLSVTADSLPAHIRAIRDGAKTVIVTVASLP
ncbi:MAG: hypothetical protein WCC90_19010, partial [Methylocella sp.]